MTDARSAVAFPFVDNELAVLRTEMAVRIEAGEFPGVELVDAHLDHNAGHGENPELTDPDDER